VESVRVRIPAQSSTTIVVGHLAFGDMIHRATFSLDNSLSSPGATLALALYQYRAGTQIGSAALANLSLPVTTIVYSLNAFEFSPPPTPDAVQYFEDLDTMILTVSWTGTPLAFTGLLSWM
jgi:hypothetical protein